MRVVSLTKRIKNQASSLLISLNVYNTTLLAMLTFAIVIAAIIVFATWVNSRIRKRVPQNLPGWNMWQSMINLRKFRRSVVESTKSGAKWWRMYVVGQETMIATHPDTIKVRNLKVVLHPQYLCVC